MSQMSQVMSSNRIWINIYNHHPSGRYCVPKKGMLAPTFNDDNDGRLNNQNLSRFFGVLSQV